MDRQKWILLKLLRGNSTKNIRFDDLRTSLKYLGFEERIRGSNHLFCRPDIGVFMNLQRNGGKAKPYQVRQARKVISKFDLGKGPSDA